MASVSETASGLPAHTALLPALMKMRQQDFFKELRDSCMLSVGLKTWIVFVPR